MGRTRSTQVTFENYKENYIDLYGGERLEGADITGRKT
jgi:hypothetical protein